MNERYANKHNKRVEISGFTIATLGSLLVIIGYCIPYLNYPNIPNHPGVSLLLHNSHRHSIDTFQQFVSVVALFIFVMIICLFILSVLALIGFLNKRVNKLSNSTYVMIILTIFLFLPALSPHYTPMICYIVGNLTSAGSSVTYSRLTSSSYELRTEYAVGFYFLAIGVILLISSYTFLLYSSYKRWDNSPMRRKKQTSIEVPTGSYKRILDIVISSLGIFASVGIIVGLTTPLYYWVFRLIPEEEPVVGYIFGTKTNYDAYAYYARFDTIFYLILVISLLTFFIMQIISYYKSQNMSNYKSVIFFLLIILMLLPSSNPESEGYAFTIGVVYFLMDIYYLFSSAAYSKNIYDQGASDSKYVVSPTVWIMVISLIVLFLILIFYFINFLQTKIEKR